jgi:hypothetical protein
MLRPKYNFGAHSEETLIAFEALKRELIQCQALFMARRDLGPWIMRCDASNLGAAAVLLQRCPLTDPGAIGSTAQEEDGVQLQPIAMVSVPLSESARTNWSTHTAELYAIVQGCKKLSTMIDGHPLIIETDHRNLLFAQQNHAALTARWIAWLQANFNIVAVMHRPGVRNTLADTLSRLYMITAMDAVAHLDAYPTAAEAVARISASFPLRDASYKDAVDNLAQLDATEPLSLVGPRGEVLLHAEEELNPLTDTQVPAPIQGLRITLEEAFAAVHNPRAGHVGWRRTYNRIKEAYPALQCSGTAVKALVDDCPTCQKYRLTSPASATEVLHSIPMPTAAGLVTADTFKLPVDANGMTHVLVIVNHATKMTDLQPMPAKTSEEVCRALFAHFCREVVPSLVLTDPGTELKNADVDSLLRWLNIAHGLTLVKRPQGHGTERTIGKTKLYLAILIGAENALARWSDKTVLPAAQYFLNSNFNEEIGCPPMQLRYGSLQYECFRRLAEVTAGDDAIPPTVAEIDAAFRAMQTRADSIQAHAKARRKGKGDSPEDQHFFQAGDFIFWHSDALLRPHGSLSAWFLGPFEVLRQESYSVTARHLASGKVSILHHSKCRICTTSREVATELSRQDSEGEHVIACILAHEGSLLDRTTLRFETMFVDGEVRWLPWSELNQTSALTSYAARYACTSTLLSEDIDVVRARHATVDLTSAQAQGIPAAGEVFATSLFAFPAATKLLNSLRPGTEHVVTAVVDKLTKRRVHLTFPDVPHLSVAWPLMDFEAFCSRTPATDAHMLDSKQLRAYDGLLQAMGARLPTARHPASHTAPPDAAYPDPAIVKTLQAKLNDGIWHDIVVQSQSGNAFDAYVPDLDVDIRVPRSRTREKPT